MRSAWREGSERVGDRPVARRRQVGGSAGRVAAHAIDHGRGVAGDGRPARIERRGESRVAPDDEEPVGRHEARHAAALGRPSPLARREIEDVDLGSLVVRRRPGGPDREENPLPAGQRLGPAVRALALRRIELRELLSLSRRAREPATVPLCTAGCRRSCRRRARRRRADSECRQAQRVSRPRPRIFLSLPSWKYATHCPSGEKKGPLASPVPSIGRASVSAKERT